MWLFGLFWRLGVVLGWVWFCCGVGLGGEGEGEGGSRFLRFVEEGGVGRVDTGLGRYVLGVEGKGDGLVEVALVGALHVGDGGYYEGLNVLFRGFDVVLYEMIRGGGSGGSGGGRGVRLEVVGGVQRLLQSVLGLEFQLECVDYGAGNFVHADLDAGTFGRLQRERGESFFSLFLESVLYERQLQRSGVLRPVSVFELLGLLSGGDGAEGLKWVFARQLEQTESVLAGVGGGDSVIVSERNRVAMEVLDEQLGLGRRRVAIFYGAGHMLDLEGRLLGRGFRKVGHEWLTAWRLERVGGGDGG